MSGVLHAIGKVFKAVWNFIKPIVKIVAIAAAVYFTAGVALSAFPATAGFAAALPGFAANGVAGAGIFSSAASSIGLGGGLASGAAADAAAAAAAAGGVAADAGVVAAGAGAAAGSTAAAASDAALAGAAQAGVAGSTAATLGATAAPTLGSAAVGAGMTLTDKLLLASVGNNVLSGLTSPSAKDLNALNKTFFGSFYGVNADGSKAPAPSGSSSPAATPATKAVTAAQTQIPGVTIPGQVNAQPATIGATPSAQTETQQAQQQSLIPTVAYSGQPQPGQTPDFAVTGSTPNIKPQLIPS